MRRIIFLFVLLISVMGAAAQTVSTVDWMGGIADATPMRCISIPGSHDSGAKLGNAFWQVQDTTIARQLDLGIRFFDIRLKADVIPGVMAETKKAGKKAKGLGLYHSVQYMAQQWETDVLPVFLDFLKQHPSEAVIVLINREGGDKAAFTRLLSKSLKQGPYVREFSNDITLKECRGKILFLFREDAGKHYPGLRCSGWNDNVTCDVTLTTSKGVTAIASVEDEYGYDDIKGAQHKIEATLANIESAHHIEGGKWFLTYTSCTAIPNNTGAEFAAIVNPAVLQALSSVHQPSGVILLDFCEHYQDLIKTIISTNR